MPRKPDHLCPREGCPGELRQRSVLDGCRLCGAERDRLASPALLPPFCSCGGQWVPLAFRRFCPACGQEVLDLCANPLTADALRAERHGKRWKPWRN